jgi:hypothetical protein
VGNALLQGLSFISPPAGGLLGFIILLPGIKFCLHTDASFVLFVNCSFCCLGIITHHPAHIAKKYSVLFHLPRTDRCLHLKINP